jgi:hypothetical protein
MYANAGNLKGKRGGASTVLALLNLTNTDTVFNANPSTTAIKHLIKIF